jgi:hypothetical protein
MSVVPRNKPAKVAFFQSKVAPWTEHAVAIGTTSTAVTDLSAKVTAALAKLEAQVAAEQASKTATMAADNAVAVLARAGADIIKSIRAKAAVAGVTVYELAELPDPAIPTPVATLGTPHDFRVELGADGALTLKWKCSSPRATGVIYQVLRSTDGGTNFGYVGGTGSKKFVDPSVPAGSASLVYKLQAVRSTAAGPWATFLVLFGTGAGGQLGATVAQPKLAA